MYSSRASKSIYFAEATNNMKLKSQYFSIMGDNFFEQGTHLLTIFG